MLKKEFFEINLIKGVAIVWVVLFHMYKDFPGVFVQRLNSGLTFPHLMLVGALGVNLFVIASGFLLAHSASQNKTTYPVFIFGRIKKLIPLYYGAILFVLLLEFAIGSHKIEYTWASILLHVLCMHSFSGYMFDIQGAWWYMGLIFQLYLLFPVLHNFLVKLDRNFYLVMIPLISITSIARSIDLLNLGSNYSVFAFLPDFAAGMMIYHYRKNIGSLKLFKLIFILLTVLLFGYLLHNNHNIFGMWRGTLRPLISTGLFLGFFQVFNYLINKGFSKCFTVLNMFGIYSYAIYLFHRPLIYKYVTVLTSYLNAYLLQIMFICIMLAVGYLLTKAEIFLRFKILCLLVPKYS